MSKQEKKGLVPALRFPEFRDKKGWNDKLLSQITTAIFDGTHQTPKYTDDGVPFFSVENIVSGKANKFISKEDYQTATNKNKPEKGDILITRIGNIGFSKVINWDYEFSIYVTLATIKQDNRYDPHYLHGYMQSERYQRELQSKSLLNAVPCKINMDELRKTEVLLPSPEEQQKIADCLSSIDELVTAQNQKLEALKAHKKGLMQQLFPAEGETAPKLRFPEFRKVEPWVRESFDNLYDLKVTNSLPRDKLNYKKGVVKNIHYGDIHTKFSTLFDIKEEDVPFINSTVSLDKIKPESYCKEGDMVFADASEDMDDIGKSIELVNLCGEKLLAGLHTLLARQTDTKLVKGFGGYLFKSGLMRKQIQKEAQGAKVLGISAGRILSIDVTYPSDENEQQKIVDCLSSIDELITAQSQKVESLKAHKKGLMQQLFPTVDEVGI